MVPQVNLHHAMCSYMLFLMAFIVCNGTLPEDSLAAAASAGTNSKAHISRGGVTSPLDVKDDKSSSSSGPDHSDRQVEVRYRDLPPEDDFHIGVDVDSSTPPSSEADKDFENIHQDEEDEKVLVVATIDGTFYGISQNTGDIKWKSSSNTSESTSNASANSDSKSSAPSSSPVYKKHDKDKSSESSNSNEMFNPLLSTTTTRTNNKTWRTAAVPSIDGRVYLTLGSATNSIQHQPQDTVTNNIKDLVHRAPFMDSRGRFFVSSKRAFAVALNKDTGEVLRVVKAGDGFGSNAEEDVNVFDFDNRGLLWIGRVDYEITVHDARTGEVDVQFSSSEVLSVDDMIQETNAVHGHDGPNSNPNASNGDRVRRNDLQMLPTKESAHDAVAEIFPNALTQTYTQPADLNPPILNELESNILSTPGGRLALRDPESGDIQWISRETFDSPVAYAIESSTGSSLGVHVVPDAPLPHLFSEDYLENQIERELNLFDSSGGGRNTDNVDHDDTVFGAMTNGELFAMPLGRRKFRHGYGPYGRNGLPSVPRLSSTVGGSAKKIHAQMLAKIPPVGHGDWQNLHGPGNALAPLTIPQNCNPKSKTFPKCLTDLYDNEHLRILYDQQQKDFGVFKGSVQLPNPIYQNQGGKAKDQFRAILTSWIPPAVALAFVISFELGRREKARVEAVRNKQQLTETDYQASSESVTFRRELSDEDLVSVSEKPGVIHVSEEVLGYGGHGTVVYKGKLDGRFVAVKRMLKAYTASADREISLLIESDGHPNVVRYFLKEIRGDFVYLALELCDFNLQDLIVILSKHKQKDLMMRQQGQFLADTCGGVEPALKKTLYEIASGVKHIHQQFIVHRDMKPANILLKARRKMKFKAETDEEKVYEAFQCEMYVPKISDMGLGKQLAGQSSFGFSTFNTSLGAGLSRDQASTIAGVGPGSVGWQAPEVMAQRLSPEAASLDGSSGPESMLESSPAEISLNGRTSRSVDIFSLGCIFYCTLLPGYHPFGEWYEREANIMKNRPITDPLKDVSMEAWDLVISMLNRNPKARPTASQICQHPFFWNPSQRMAFICEFSDRLESENDLDSGSFDRLLVERQAATIVGRRWDCKIDPKLFNNVQKFRTYDVTSVRDCLRLIRNKHHHFDELPATFREGVPNQKSLLEYFENKFPSLLLHCYTACREYMDASDLLAIKYAIPCKPKQTALSTLNNVKPLSRDSSGATDDDNDATPVLNEEDTLSSRTEQPLRTYSKDIISWQGSTAASELNCRGWIRSEDEWICMTNEKIKKRDVNLVRCAEDPKFRTRLCNHWDVSQGVHCPMLKKHKCVFAHGPAELRVKEGKRNRWGRLVDVNGNNSNPQHSGGEDTFGAAMKIEVSRKVEGKWKANTNANSNGSSNATPRKKNRAKNKKSN